jgi:serine/threonine protein kinase
VQETGTLVAIRELLLSGLPEQTQAHIAAAAFEEFVSPGTADSSWFPTAGDRIWSAGERHYTVMQLQGVRCDPSTQIITLDELLTEQQQWPLWLNRSVALAWGLQLCHAIAQVHRAGGVLGDLNPATILVDRLGATTWAPILLASWPPAPQFWHTTQDERYVSTLSTQIFPIGKQYEHNVFIAPEILYGVCDERADVYSLGAILFLLVTHYAPIAALRRLYASQRALLASEKGLPLAEQDLESLDFVSLQALDSSIPPPLERLLLCALNPDPDRRYDSVADLMAALQAVIRESF